MSPQLPADAWIQVASHLPEALLYELIGLNHIFFELGMNARYRDLHLYSLSNPTIARLKHISSPAIASRVHSFKLNLALLSLRSSSRERSFNIVKHIKKAAGYLSRQPSKIAPKSPWEALHTTLLLAVQNMTNLRHCDLYGLPDHDPNLPVFFEDLWPLLKQRVRSVTFSDSMVSFHNLPRFTHEMACIEDLSFRPVVHASQWNASAAIALARALNYVAPTLRSIDLDFSRIDGCARLNFDHVFKAMTHFPELKSVRLWVPFTHPTSKAISLFLNTHAPTLEDLEITIPALDFDNPPTTLGILDLQSLKSLYVSLGSMTSSHGLYLWPGYCHFTTLTHLVLKSSVRLNNITPMCNAFRASGIGSSLRSLHLDVSVLGGDMLDELALTFSSLRSLSILSSYIWDFYRTHPLLIVPVEPVDHHYHSWGLHDLSISLTTFDKLCSRPSYIAMMIIAQYMPRIQSFNGSGNTTTPEPEQRLFSELKVQLADHARGHNTGVTTPEDIS